MGTPIDGEVDLTGKKHTRLSKHHAHTAKRASMRKKAQAKTYRFFVSPLSFQEVSCNSQHLMHTPVRNQVTQFLTESQKIIDHYCYNLIAL